MKKPSHLFILITSLITGICGCCASHSQPTAHRNECKVRPLLICAYEGADAAKNIQIQWSKTSPEPHTIFGEPAYSKHADEHNIVRRYSAFTIYYDDEILSPRWAAIKITKEIADKNKNIKRLPKFKVDKTLEEKGYEVASHDDYKNPTGMKKWARGHMVQFDDARGYGKKAAEESFYTTNICPQLSALNGQGWLSLEKLCTEYARDYGVVWVYTGPIYEKTEPFAPNRKIPKPTAFYKVAVSPGEDGGVDVLAFIMPHEPIKSDVDLSRYLVSVDKVEEKTGLDFLRELPDEYENYLEENIWELRPDIEN